MEYTLGKIMRTKKSISFCILLILTFTVIGCKESNESEGSETIYLDSFYNSFKFKTGSYWIYEDSASKNRDSVYVSKVESGFYWNPPPVHGGSGTRREFYKLYYMNSKNDDVDTDLLENNGIRRNTELEWEICGRRYYANMGYSGYEKIDSLVINGKMFYDVVKKQILANDFVSGCTNGGFENDILFYTAPEFGIIKMEERDNDSITVWKLIRWEILK